MVVIHSAQEVQEGRVEHYACELVQHQPVAQANMLLIILLLSTVDLDSLGRKFRDRESWIFHSAVIREAY